MKLPILIALGALCITVGVANAQTPEKTPSRSLTDLLNQNPYLRDNTRTAGTRLFAAPGGQGFKAKFGVDIVRQDSGQALRQIANVLGVPIVIDPAIEFLPAKTRTFYFNYLSDDIFADVTKALLSDEAVETWKSAAGTTFFAAKPVATLERLERQLDQYNLENEPRRADDEPFVFPRGLYPNLEGRFGIPIEPQPQPHWEKREFNGREFYYIPMPKQ